MNRMRKGFVLMFLCFLVTIGHAQVIFTYGNKSVTREEFLKAFNKNNTEQKPTEKAYRDYLELYIRFKLRVQAALDMKLDTLPAQLAELQAFRTQVVESYMKDDESLNALIDEVIRRSEKDVRIAHIFVAAGSNATEADVKKAQEKIQAAWNRLKKGESFEKVALDVSEDPAVKTNKGDIGYLSVFALPYELETLAWSTSAGKFSAPYQSRNGFHIFKNLDEREAAGKVRVAHILLAFPPDATEADKNRMRQKADSVYQLLQQGGDFKALAQQFSGDNLSYMAGGEMAAFGPGRFEPAFENAAFGLAKDGDFSKPVLTTFGYHIIKRLERIPVNNNRNDHALREEIRNQIESDKRMDVARNALMKKIFAQTGFRKNKVNTGRLWVFADSVLQNKNVPSFGGLNAETPLFTFAGETYRLKDWQSYLEGIRDYPHLHAGKTKQELFDQFAESKAYDYYRDHLETYNKDFAHQLNEFREGNLLFEIMQRNIWEAAASDSAALRKYYNGHKDKYWWEPSADVILFTASDAKAAEGLRAKLKSNYRDWLKYIETSGGSLQGDSGRFELSQIPVPERTRFTNGLTTANVKNDADSSVTFAYVVTVYPERAPRSFEDARGFVINDYQAELEEKWITELKNKYPVKVNEAVVKALPK